MLQMLRSASSSLRSLPVRTPAARPSPYTNFMLYRDGKPFMVVNAPSMDHARLVIANFPSGHAWMLVEQG